MGSNDLTEFAKEVKLLHSATQLPNPYLVKFFGISKHVETSSRILIVMEFHVMGQLTDLLI